MNISPIGHFDAEPVAEVVDVLRVVLHQRHVVTRHRHVEAAVRRVRLGQDLLHLELVFLFLGLKRHETPRFGLSILH